MRDAHSDEGADVVAHRSWIEAGDVADDRPRPLKLAHPVGDGWLREPDGGGDVHLRRLRVGLEEIEDLIIYRVKGPLRLPTIGERPIRKIDHGPCARKRATEAQASA